MRVPGNKIKHLYQFFFTELDGVHEKSEIDALFFSAAFEILKYNKTDLLLKQEENINQSDLLKLYDCAKALKKNQPLQYILKKAWFYNLDFYVDKAVLIPRPETEELVDLILKENENPQTILDVGTGSGCIPITLKKHRPSANISACDISKNALMVAEKNALKHQTKINFITVDVLSGKFESAFEGDFDIIASNPPYIKSSERESMSPNVLEYEPHLALFVEDSDACIFYKKIIDFCSKKLKAGGKLYFELNPDTANEVYNYASNSDIFSKILLEKDMSGALRFLKAIKK